MRLARVTAFFGLFALLSVPLWATTFLPATDADLVRGADAVVIGTVTDSMGRVVDGAIKTESHLQVERVLKGEVSAGAVITIDEFGGSANGQMLYIVGEASYGPGERVLAFLRHDEGSRWHTTSMSLGKFTYAIDGRGRQVVLRSTDGEGDERPRLAHEFEQYIDAVVHGRDPQIQYIDTTPRATTSRKAETNGYPASAYCLAKGWPFRWGGQPGITVKFSINDKGGTTASMAGSGSWNGAPNATINLSTNGTNPGSDPNQYFTTGAAKNTVYLGWTGSLPAGVLCDGTAACAMMWLNTSNTHTFNGETFYSILEADVILKPGTVSDTVVTHEFGHTIGLRHADQGTPSSGAAIMTAVSNTIFGRTLQQWDKDAAATVYGSGPPCLAPTNVQISVNTSVTSGQTARMTATASGTTPITFQWYQGSAGDTSKPVGTGTTYTSGPITSPTTFWVNATNSCGNAASPAVTITPAACASPTILKDVQGQTITSGSTVTLTIGTGGTAPFTYQWYEGQSGDDTSKAVSGATEQTFTSPPLTKTTSYWVKVSNSCGSINSSTAVITVPGTCTPPTIDVQPQSITVETGRQSFLFASSPDAKSYQWYQGLPGDTSKPLTGSTPSNDRWVTQVFVDIFGRTPTAAEVATYSGMLGAKSRTDVLKTVLSSTEYRTALIQTFYSSYLGRSADPAGLTLYLTGFAAGLNDEQIAAQILGSAEFYALAGSTPAGWVTLVYRDVLGRAPTASDLSYWSSVLTTTSRTNAAQSILTSTETAIQRVQRWVRTYLRRAVTPTESTNFVASLAAGGSDESVIAQILAANEYFDYPTVLVVGPVAGPTSYWVAAINDCSPTNSGAATVSLPSCAAPVIVVQPQSGGMNIGDSTRLSVIAAGATAYQWYSGSTGDTTHPISGATSPAFTTGVLTTTGNNTFWVKVSNSCTSVNSETATLVVNCAVSAGPEIHTQANAGSGSTYGVSWTAPSSTYDHFELQESTSSNFASPTTYTTTSTSYTIPGHTVTAPTRYYYRVRGFLSCSKDTAQPYSTTASTLVTAPPPPSPPLLSQLGPPCATVVGQTCTVTGSVTGTWTKTGKWGTLATTDTFTVTADEPWITFSPSSGTIPPDGNVTVNYTIDTTNLPNGSTNATITFNFTSTPTSTAGKPVALGTTTSSNIPLSVNLVSPVSPLPKDNNPPPNTLVIPAVAHAAGAGNSQFVTDLRLVNTAPQTVDYQLTFTPTTIDGTTSGKSFQISVKSGETKAINDIVQSWFGSGAAGEGGIGTVEIRPLNYLGKGPTKTLGTTNTGLSLTTVAASRTYNVTTTGTFGQFIPAIPLANFLGKGASKISLQQIAQSTAFRTNLGLIEGSGQPVNLEIRLLDSSGKTVSAVPWLLKAYEHQQWPLSTIFPGANFTDGRIEVKAVSDTGKVSAYASVLDNTTSDPLAVFPVQPDLVSGKMYVIPGVADLNNGAANFHTDARIYNGGGSAVTATLTYVPQAGSPGASAPLTLTINPGEVKVLDDTLKSSFNVTNSGGALLVTTADASSLILTARTFSRGDDGGTFGQFIPGVTAADGVGSTDRPLQVIQLEQSPAFRSNVGLVEVTGKPVIARIKGYSPDSKVTPQVDIGLGANEFRQLSSIFAQMGFPTVYNGRVTVEVINGDGKVAAYGSVIDNRTQDPTYVPAQ